VGSTERPQIWIESFGGLKLLRDGGEVALGSVRPLAILAILLAARGDPVSIDRLVTLFWNDNPPQSAVNQIHRHVGELRRLLEPDVAVRGDGSFIERRPAGYRLQLGVSESQLESFFSDAEAAARSADAGATLDALDLYAKLLRGAVSRPFLDLPSELVGASEFEALESARLRVAVDAADLALRSGVAERIADPFLRIAASAPFNEVVQARAIRLLTAAGRGAEAAQLYDSVRTRLDLELGVSPGKELKSALSQIAESADVEESKPSVFTLPPDVGYFLERESLKDALDTLAQDARDGRGVVALITGMGGIGKTSLAVHWARSLASDFPDGQVYLNLLGFDPSSPALTTDQAVDQLLAALKLQTSATYSPEDRRMFLRENLQSRRILILLDNAKSSDQVRPLLAGAPHGLVVVTSRDNLVSLAIKDGARRIPVGRWTADESRDLWDLRVGPGDDMSNEAVGSVIDFCAGLPLALSIVASQASSLGVGSATIISREIARTPKPLDVFSLESEDDDLRSTFAWSYRSLSADAQRLFALLSVHPGPIMSLRSIASLSEMSVEAAGRVAGELVSANLLTRSSGTSYVMHDLVRAFAGEVLDADELVPARTRIFDHYLRALRTGTSVMGFQYDFAMPVVGEQSTGEQTLANYDEAVDWYEFEYAVIDALFERALDLGFDAVAVAIELERRPLHEHLYGVSPSQALDGLAAAVRLGDPSLIAEMHRSLFAVYLFSRPDEQIGWDHAAQAVEMFKAVGDESGLRGIYSNMSYFSMRLAEPNFEDALRFTELTIASAERSDSPKSIVIARFDKATILVNSGRWEEAVRAGEEMFDQAKLWRPQLVPELHGLFSKASFGLGDYSRCLADCLTLVSQNGRDDPYDLEVISMGACAAANIGDVAAGRSLVQSFRSIVAVRPDLVNDLYGTGLPAFVERVDDAERRMDALSA
jgi:DNA-binding SARP family transcriptional activator